MTGGHAQWVQSETASPVRRGDTPTVPQIKQPAGRPISLGSGDQPYAGHFEMDVVEDLG